MKKKNVCFCLILLCVFLFCVSSSYAERVLGKGHGIKITDNDVDLFKQYLVPKNIEPTQKALFEVILKTKLFSLAAQKEGLDEQEKIKKRLELEKEKILAQIYAQNYLNKNLKIDDQVIESYYLSHIDEFTMPARLKLYRLVVPTLDEAQKVYKEAQRNPSEFPKLVEKYSIDPATKWKKGEMGQVALNRLRPEIKQVLSEPKTGMITKPLKIHGFYYIFWVKEVEPKRIIPLEKVKRELRDKIAKQKQQEVLQAHLAELQKKYGFKWEPAVQNMMQQKQFLRVK